MLRFIPICLIILHSWGCAQKSAKLQKSIVPPDKTLYETGMDYLDKSQYIKSRLAFQTLISTYPDSEMAAEAKMAIGDSFYDEGGTENLLQAEEQYKDFIVFWPTHAKAAEAQLKVVSLNMRMMRSPDRDPQYSVSSEREIKKFLDMFPDSDYAPIVRQYLLEVQENLALGDLGVAQFYADRKNWPGVRGRLQEIIDHYPNFSGMDDVLFRLAQVQENSNNPEEAAGNYAKIVSAYSFSRHTEEAKARLISLGKPLPSVDTQLNALNQARLKPGEGFSPLRPMIDFAKALGFVGAPDRYEQAKRSLEEEKTKTADAARAGRGGPTADDTQIQVTIKKSATGETQDSTVIDTGSGTTRQSSPEQKTK
jgi:outer membrane assembly lipoprotein YfiO